MDNLSDLNLIKPIIQMQVDQLCKQRSFCIMYQDCTVLYQAQTPEILGRVNVNIWTPEQNGHQFADDISNAFSWMKSSYFDSNIRASHFFPGALLHNLAKTRTTCPRDQTCFQRPELLLSAGVCSSSNITLWFNSKEIYLQCWQWHIPAYIDICASQSPVIA